MKSFCVALAVAVVFLMSNLAKAQTDLVNTGAPTGGSFFEVDSIQSFAAEFNIQAGQTVTSIAPYLTQGDAQPGQFFTLDIYSALPARNGGSLAYTVSAQWETNGFDVVSTNWTPTIGGNYWVAVTNGSGNFLDLENLASNSTGNPAALGYEYAGSTGSYTAAGAPSFGLEIVATPEPTSWALGLVGIGAFGVMSLWRRAPVRA
jgi:hypothetical protein